MKKLGLCLIMALFTASTFAQSEKLTVKFAPLDPSPMDALYYPLNAAKVKKDDDSMPIIKVLYSRPAKKGREIFGVLEQFGKIWRLGANENTEIYFSKAVTIANQRIKPGKYSLFAIPHKEKWTIIVNKQTDRWGAFSYNQDKDVVRLDVSTTSSDKTIELFSMTFNDLPNGANLIMAWDNTQVAFPIYFSKQ